MSNESWHQIVLSFWFEELAQKDWFKSSTALDETISSRFAAIHTQVSNESDLDGKASPDRALASVIVLDQFSRNMFRGTAQAFASDPLALRFTKQSIERQLHQNMTTTQKQFLFMPLMHSENLADQHQCLPLFEALGLAEHAIEHKKLIDRYGRFPYRNEVLGRPSTKEELAYLKDGKRFGQ